MAGQGGAEPAPALKALEEQLAQILEARPDASDFPVRAGALRFDEGPQGIHYALVVDVALPRTRAGAHPTYQILVRLTNAQREVVLQQAAERVYRVMGDAPSSELRLVWTRQATLRPGSYTLEALVRNARLMTSVVRTTFEARPYGLGPRVSSVALLSPSSSQRLDDTLEADDPFRFEGRPLMPALAPRAAAGRDAKMEFIAYVFPDPANPAAVAARAELLRGEDVVGSLPLSLPKADERGALLVAGAMPLDKIEAGAYRLRIVAEQGDRSAKEEAELAVEWRPRVALQTWPSLSRPELAEIARMHSDDRAIDRLKRLDQGDAKNDPEVVYLLSVKYLGLHAYADAEKAARRAAGLTTDPTALGEIHYCLARALCDGEKKDIAPNSERLRAAEAELRTAIELTGGRLERFHLQLAGVLTRLARGGEAQAVLAEILERPDLPEEIATLARSLSQSPRCATEACLPQLSYVTPEGERRTSDDLRGRVVLLSFWATWCGPCVRAMPELKNLYKRYAKAPFVLIGINEDHDRGDMEAFVASNKIPWPQLDGEQASLLGKKMGVGSLPTEILFDHEGVAVARSRGWGHSTYFQLLGRIDDAVKAAKKAAAQSSPASQ